MPELLLELFSEEIPARMQARAAEDLRRMLTEALAAIALTTSASTSSLLDTDAVNGLQLTVTSCSVPWTEAGTSPAFTYTCSGTQGTVLASRAVITANQPLAASPALTAGGAALGLILGGVLTEYLSWRWVFFVNIPIAVLAVVGALKYVPESRDETARGFDVPGAVLVTAALTLLPHVRAELDETELGLLTMARGRGLTWLEIAEALGLGSAQAAQQRHDRLAARLDDSRH